METQLLRVPRTDPANPLVLDTTQIVYAQERLPEVAFSNTSRAPELMAVFNMAYLNTTRCLAQLEYELIQAKTRANSIKAVLLLDRLPGMLQAKGLSTARSPLGSEDIRQAFLDSDPEYLAALELTHNTQCYIAALEGQKRAFENAYNAVKKMLGQDTSTQRQNLNLPTAYNPSPAYEPPPTNTPPTLSPEDAFWGS
jgi:hypothetical protein